MDDKPLTRADMLARYQHWTPRVEAVALPDGGTCYVRLMDGFSLSSWQAGNYELVDGEVQSAPNAYGRLAVRCLCDAKGQRLFPNDAEADALGGWPADVLQAICEAAKRLNKLDAKASEGDAKNLPATRTNSCGAGSPENSAAPSPKPTAA